MARKLEQVKNDEAGDADAPVLSNIAGLNFDPREALRDVDNIIELADQAKEDAQPVKDEKARIKAERGYNMKGFGFGLQMRRADVTEARDMLRTALAVAEGIGLVNAGAVKMVPDLVDMMEQGTA